jgi:hypothetical protein
MNEDDDIEWKLEKGRPRRSIIYVESGSQTTIPIFS